MMVVMLMRVMRVMTMMTMMTMTMTPEVLVMLSVTVQRAPMRVDATRHRCRYFMVFVADSISCVVGMSCCEKTTLFA
jgi:hypothetical protein